MGKNSKINLGAIVIIGLLISCFNAKEKKHFYCDLKADYDVWRLPIIEPFEFVSNDVKKGWTLSWPSSLNQDYLFNFSADSINYGKGLIFCFSKSGLFNLNIVDIRNQKVIRIQNRDEFNSFAKERNISSQLYSVDSVFENWRLTKKLPWRQEIPGMPECKSGESNDNF